MKSSVFVSTAAALLISFCAAAENTWKLPAPQRDGGVSLTQALNLRSTKRVYQNKELCDQQISNLLWSANGINRANGKRTAPSAVNRQEIDLYLLNSKAAYKYNAANHTLTEINRGDFRKLAGKFSAPVYIVLVADMKKAASTKYALIDTGYVSQNIYLYCAGAKLGTCAIGSFDRIKGAEKGQKLHQALKLNSKQRIQLTHSVGLAK